MRSLLLTVLLAAAFGSPAAARGDSAASVPSGLALDARLGYGGLARLGAWVPVQVDVANEGPDVAGRVEVQFEASADRPYFGAPPAVYSVPASFPQHSRKHLELAVPVPFTPGANHAQVRLVVGDRPVLQRAQEFEPLSNGSLLCGAIDQTLGAYDFLAGLDLPGKSQRPRVADLSPADLPDQGALLASLDCLVIGDVNLSGLTGSQKTALSAWVARGGLLIVTGGPNWQQSLSALPASLLPVRVNGLAALPSIAPLESFARTGPAGSGPWPAARATLTDGAIVAGDAAAPLLATHRFGAGSVFFYALDPTQEPARSWAGNRFLWQDMLSYAGAAVAAGPVQQPFASWGATPVSALSSLPDLSPPFPIWLLLFLAGYALALGPVAYFVLGRFDRREWLLLLWPLGSLLGTGATAHLALGHQGSDMAATQVTLLRADAASPIALEHVYLGLVAPRPQSIDLHVPAGSLLTNGRRPFSQTSGAASNRSLTQVSEGMDVFVPAVQLDPGALTTFVVDSQATLGGGMVGALTADAQLIRGQVQNKTGQRLNDASLVVGSTVYNLGTLGVNESRNVSIALPPPDRSLPDGKEPSLASQLYPQPRAGVRAADDPRRDVLDRVFGASGQGNMQPSERVGGVMLVGWLDQAPLRIDIRHARAATRQVTLLLARLPLAMDPGSPPTIGTSLMETRPLIAVGVTQAAAGHISVAAGGSYGVEYTLPASPTTTPAALRLAVAGSFSGGTSFAANEDLGAIAAFDWARGEWRSLPLRAGDNVYSASDGLISPNGQVRLRYGFKAPPGSSATGIDFTQFALTVSGRTA